MEEILRPYLASESKASMAAISTLAVVKVFFVGVHTRQAWRK